MQHMSPPVDPSLYVLDFLPVHLAVDGELRAGETRLLPLAHVYVLVVSVKAGSSGSVYFTSGRLHEKDEPFGKEKAWLRRDGSVREMTQRMVAERMHAINRHDEQQARDRDEGGDTERAEERWRFQPSSTQHRQPSAAEQY